MAKEIDLTQAARSLEVLDSLVGIRIFSDLDAAKRCIAYGCLLISVSAVDNDAEGEGFRFLVGRPEGICDDYIDQFDW